MLWQALAHEGATIETTTPAEIAAPVGRKAESRGQVIRRVGRTPE